MEQLNRDAERIARSFGLRYRCIQAERSNVRSRYGVCYSDGTIKIRLRNLRTGRPLKYSGLVDTLCHELAHLRHFDHGPRFQALWQRLREFARREGIYRPDPAGGASARLAAPVRARVPPRPRSVPPRRAGPPPPEQLPLL